MTKFEATGQGYFNRWPDKPADSKTGNGLLKNTALTDGDDNHKLWLYVTGVSSSWTLQGTQSQTSGRRSFNPQHMTQEPLVVRGQMPNQYEYDRLVEFIARHHEVATGSSPAGVMQAITTGDGTEEALAVSFRLVPYNSIYWTTPPEPKPGEATLLERVPDEYRIGKGIYQLVPIHLEGFITEIRAGARRFENAPTFEFGLQVTRDFIDPEVAGIGSLNNSHWWQMFGPFYSTPQDPPRTTGDRVVGAIADGVEDIQGGDVLEGVGHFVDAAQLVWEQLSNEIRGND